MLKKYLLSRARLIERSLEKFLPSKRQMPAKLHEAIRYSVFGKAKRIRPILTLAVSDMLGGKRSEALIPACALEMIHASSLVHDDLPSMDNDDYRRGRLTTHKKYGEAEAILVGDSLLIEAFCLLSRYPDKKRASELAFIIAEAAGSRGMVGGQFIEKEMEGSPIGLPTLNLIHINKTGKLFLAACLAGAVSARSSAADLARVRRFGECLGFVFQIVDDILDKDGYLKFMSATEAKQEAERVTERAKRELAPFGRKAKYLVALADMLVARTR